MASTVSGLTVTLVGGTERQLLARWSWNGDTNKTDHFDVSWQYDTGNGVWISGTEATANLIQGNLRQSTYTAPNNAYKVRVAVKPVGKDKESNGKKDGKYYEDAAYCKFVYFPLNNLVLVVPYTMPVFDISYVSINRHPTEATTVYVNLSGNLASHLKDKVNVAILTANEFDNSIGTTSKPHTFEEAFAGYDYEWQYYAGSTWFPGNSGNSGSEQIITYQYPATATKVRVRIRAVANEYTSKVDSKDYLFFTNVFSSWKQVNISDLVETPPKYDPYDITKITFSLEAGSSSNVMVRFPEYSYTSMNPATKIMESSPYKHIGSYLYVWYYLDPSSTGDNAIWINAGSGSTGTSATARYFTFTPPTGTKRIAVRIRPVSKTYQKYGVDNYYWTTSWSNNALKDMSSFNATIPTKNPITDENIVINFLNGGSGTLYASWKWTEANTASYDYEWEYATGNTGPEGNIWFEGSNGSSPSKSCTFSIPTGATAVQFRVRPVSTTYTDAYTRELSYWTSSFSSWRKAPDVVQKKPIQIGSPGAAVVWSIPGANRSAYATIPWVHDNTDHAVYMWSYAIMNGNSMIWFDESESTTSSYQNNAFNVPNYSIPEQAVKIRIKSKIVAQTYEDEHFGGQLEYWYTEYSTWAEFDLSILDPPTPSSGPSVDITANGRLTATLSNYTITTAGNAKLYVEFQILQDSANVIASGENMRVPLNYGYAELKYIVPTDGHNYRVRARGVIGTNKFGEWSAWSETKYTGPATPKSLISAQAYGVDRVKLTWERVESADTYVIEYIDKQELFDVSGSAKTAETSDNVTMYVTDRFSGDDFGKTWYFRVKAKNSTGSSGWTNVLSCTLARTPSAPTTWSETGVIPLGDIARLFWVHNAEDNSNETQATITYRLSTDPENPIEVVINDDPSDENVSDMIHTYEIDTSEYETGCMIYWSVKTKGAAPDYSDSSAERQIGVYANPTVSFTVDSEIVALPIEFRATAEPPQQTAVSWNVSITALEEYSTVDNVGNTIHINAGQVIYSKFLDASFNIVDFSIGAGDVTLENNIQYSITVTVGMNSGLSASTTHEFTVSFSYDVPDPDAEILLNSDDFSASIRPYVYNNDINGYDGSVVMSVYRKEYDGRFVAIAKNLANTGYTSVIDPHPSLNSARYRIVATSLNTGHSSYIDLSGASFNVAGMVIQWGDTWSEYDPDMSGDRIYEEPKWTGSLVHLPYNVDISEEVDPDVALIEYIGRSAPVTYFGTQLGVGGSWSTVIAANDYDTIYALRRLAIYRGNAYIRSSNGIGYWAQVNVSFQKTNREVTIPVTFTVKRVEGGI